MAAKQKKASVSFIDGIALTTLKPGRLYSARVRMDPDAHLGGEHETWYWSKSRKIEAPSKAVALEKAEKYRDELVNGDCGISLTVARFAREWQAGREEQSKASFKSTGVADPSSRTIERDEIDIRRIEEYFPRVMVRDLTPERIEKTISAMREDGVSENSIFKTIKKLRQVLNRPVLRGRLERNPCDLIDGISEPKISPEAKALRRITEEDAAEFIVWLYGQKLDGRIVALWLGMTEHIRLGEALALRACDLDFENDAIHIRGTLNKRCEIVPAKAGSERVLAMGSFLKGLLLAWIDIQKAEFPTMVKKWRRGQIPCGREWDETAPVCSSYYGTHINSDNYGRWMRSLMVERGLGEYTIREEWVDSRGIRREKLSGYRGPSFKSLRSFGATYLVGENVDVKTAQEHFGHRKSATTLEIYAEGVPAHEREVAKAMDSFVRTALGSNAPENRSLEAFREALVTMDPEEWPSWVSELADLAGEKRGRA